MPPEDQKTEDSPSYDFIMQADEPAPKSFYERLNKKLLIALGSVVIVLLIAGGLVMSSLNAQASAKQQQHLLEVAQLQTEIIRVADKGAVESTNAQTQARAQAISDSLNKSLSNVKSLLNDRSKATTPEELGSKQNNSTDDALKKALVYGNYDKTFEKLIDKQFLDYQRSLLAAENSGNKQEKVTLDKAYNEANAILGLVDQ